MPRQVCHGAIINLRKRFIYLWYLKFLLKLIYQEVKAMEEDECLNIRKEI